MSIVVTVLWVARGNGDALLQNKSHRHNDSGGINMAPVREKPKEKGEIQGLVFPQHSPFSFMLFILSYQLFLAFEG